MQKRINVLNIYLDKVDIYEAINEISFLSKLDKVSIVVTPNLDFIYLANKYERFRQIIKYSSLSLTDGMPLVWMSRLKGVKHKVSGSDLAPLIIKESMDQQFRIFLLGGAEGVAEKAKRNMLQLYPNAMICGFYSPPKGFEHDKEEINKIIHLLKLASANVVFCCFGAPKQEFFVYDNREILPNSVYINLGATIDFMSGNAKRAPKWISSIGFEWLYRTIKEPRRLLWRYIRDIIILPVVLFKVLFKLYER